MFLILGLRIHARRNPETSPGSLETRTGGSSLERSFIYSGYSSPGLNNPAREQPTISTFGIISCVELQTVGVVEIIIWCHFFVFSLLFNLVFTRRALTLIFAFSVRFTYCEIFPFYLPCYFYLYVFLLFSYRRLTADPGTWIPFVFMSGQSRREQRRRKCRGISEYGAYSEIESDSGVQSTIGEDVASVVGEASLVVSIEEHESENIEGDELSVITVRESDRIPLDSVGGVGQERDESVVRSKSRGTVRATTHHRSVSRASRNGGASMVPSTTRMSRGRERESRERSREIVERVLDDDPSSEGDYESDYGEMTHEQRIEKLLEALAGTAVESRKQKLSDYVNKEVQTIASYRDSD